MTGLKSLMNDIVKLVFHKGSTLAGTVIVLYKLSRTNGMFAGRATAYSVCRCTQCNPTFDDTRSSET